MRYQTGPADGKGPCRPRSLPDPPLVAKSLQWDLDRLPPSGATAVGVDTGNASRRLSRSGSTR